MTRQVRIVKDSGVPVLDFANDLMRIYLDYSETRRDNQRALDIAEIKFTQEQLYRLQRDDQTLRINKMRIAAEKQLQALFKRKVKRDEVVDVINGFRGEIMKVLSGTGLCLWGSVQEEAALYAQVLLNQQPHLHETVVANILIEVLPDLPYEDLIIMMHGVDAEDFEEQYQEIVERRKQEQLQRERERGVIGLVVGVIVIVGIIMLCACLTAAM